MLKIKIKTLLNVLLVLLAWAFIACSLLIASQKAYAYNPLPTGNNLIGNIYKSNGKFDKDNLDLLAKKAGYNSVDEMTTAAADGEIKTSADFGDIAVKFGSYTFKGTTRELNWIPAYLSNSDEGPILTLWLANTVTANGSISNQELSTFSDATRSESSRIWNGKTIYSDTYDGSYVRHYILNGSTDYAAEWDTGRAVTPPAAETLTKFSLFTSGDAAQYIVTPSQVSWQYNANYMKNDPKWNGSGGKGKGANYPSDWLNDKLWLPSVYETYDSTITANSVSNKFTDNSGLWKTDVSKRANNKNYPELRSAWATQSTFTYHLPSDGKSVCVQALNYTGAVRPALHLNLSLAVANSEGAHTHNMSHTAAKAPTCTTDGNTEYWYCDGCEMYFSDEEGENEITLESTVVTATGHTLVSDPAVAPTCITAGKTEGSHCSVCNEVITAQTTVAAKGHSWGEWQRTREPTEQQEGEERRDCSACDEFETRPVDKLEHKHTFATGWSSDATNHWHDATCGHNVKDGLSAHAWNDGEVTTEATCTKEGVKTFTCTVCNKTKTEKIAKVAHAPDISAATCTSAQKCTVCNTQLAAALGHDWATEWSKDETNHWHICSRCNEKNGNAAHEFKWVVDKAASTTQTGLRHEECVCGEKRNENTVIPVLTCGHSNKTHHEAVPATCVATGTVEYWYCNDCKKNIDSAGLEITDITKAIDPSAHDWGEWEVVKEATFTEEGSKRRECTLCHEEETETIPVNGSQETEITLTLGTNFVYGDVIAPVVSSNYGVITLKWYNAETSEELAEKPKNVGKYKLVATVEENLAEGYKGATKEVSFEITARAITVTINAASSVLGDPLEELTATVTSGSLVDGDDLPYVLSTNADINVLGTYAITGVCTDDNYNVTFVDGVYIVSKKANDPEVGGEIDLPVDINVEFKVTQSQTAGDYSELEGMKYGYWAQLWYRNEDGTLGDEFTDKMNCILTLKIPTEIIEGIRGGAEINRDKIAEGLKVYYVNSEGRLVEVKNFKIAQKEDESWIVKFNYNAKFRAEIVFYAPNVEAADGTQEPEKSSGIPWWVWLIVGLGGATLVTIIIVAVVLAKKKGNGGTAVISGTSYDDAALRAKLAEQDKKLDKIIEITDGGFNDFVDDE